MKKDKKVLENLGFTKYEASVYEALLILGSASPSDIVKKTGIHRPIVYKAISKLSEYGLISSVPHGKYTNYIPASPDKLSQIFKEIELDFFKKIEDLHTAYENQKNKPKIIYKEGKEAIRDAFSEMIHSLGKGETYYRYSSTGVLSNSKSYVPRDYRQIRDKKGLERLVITNEPNKKSHSLSLGRSIKSIPADYDLFEYGISQLIYRDKVVMLDYNSKSAITIENAKFAEFQKKLFKLLFKKL